jgi:aminoglycoside phosphotransferase (APT) family kinase protein
MSPDGTPREVAEAIGWRFVEVCAGGEFGACIVADAAGLTAVMKVRHPSHLDAIRASAAWSERLRAIGYPVPEHLDDGEALGRAYSLQERMSGTIPVPIDVAHIEQMLGLLELQRGAAGVAAGTTAPAWPDRPTRQAAALERFRAFDPLTATMADGIESLIERQSTLVLPATDVCHGDFHHRNVLAAGATVTAIIDWEGASVGDRCADAFLLGATLRSGNWDERTQPAADLAWSEAMRLLAADEAACYAARFVLSRLEYYLRVYPDLGRGIAARFDEWLGPLWR